MSDVLSILGNSKCEVVSCVDIKDAYHSIRLTGKSKEYCGILPYLAVPYTDMRFYLWELYVLPQYGWIILH